MAAEQRRGRARLGAGMLAAFIAVGWVAAGPAPTAGAVTKLHVEVGYAGRYQPGRSVPVRVRVDSDRLLRGTLVIRQAQQNLPSQVDVEIPVEVAGGSVAQLTASVPNVMFGNDARVEVELRVGDHVVGSGE